MSGLGRWVVTLWSVGVFGGCVHAPQSPAPLSPRLPTSRTVLLVLAEGPPRVTLSYVKDLLRKELSSYGYKVESCINDMQEETEFVRAFDALSIKSRRDSPHRDDIFLRLAKAGCQLTEGSTLFTARIAIQDDVEARTRAITFSLRNLDNPAAEQLSGSASQPLSVPDRDLIRTVLQTTLKEGAVLNRPAAGNPRKTAGVVAALVGATGLAVGVVTGVVLLAQKDKLDNGDCTNRACGPSEYNRIDSYNSLRPISTAAFAVGAIGVAMGVFLLKTSGDSTADVRIAIVPGATGLSAGVGGRF